MLRRMGRMRHPRPGLRTPRAVLALGCGLALAAHAGRAAATQDCTSGPFVTGVDVADGQGAIDWASAAGAGIAFAYMKASQGTYDTDSTFAANWSGSKAAGVIRGAYHFLDPTISGVDQATFYLNIVGTLGAGDLPPMLDIECPTSNNEPDSDNCLGIGSSGDATGAAITQVMNDWLTTVKAMTGRTPIVYSYGSYFADDGVDTTGLENYPLYIAYPTTTGCFDYPGPWTQATFWQYSWTGSVAGITGQVDLDYFLGNAAALTTFIGSGVSPIMDGGADDAGVPCVVTTTGESGVCLLTSDCAAMPDHVSTPGYCPGPADIECCTSTAAPDAGPPDGMAPSDSGSPLDAGAPDGSDAGTRPPPGADSGITAHGGDGGDGGDLGSDSGSPGCSCRTAEEKAPPGSALALAGLVGLTVRRRKRRG